ncbi:TPA: hypothetical protein DDW69_02245 [candidate division CPR2 bacterium]|uniref:EamA domain-containing protein n=1 Tax=candidate division CPR2 bacterium GW2011_GWC1_41_48 TaxID=1618344 RepID=A0A0G0WCR0_UNCC2|nr:MAG: hypothetical protein UT47_C0001G0252 [candidate division CPR2 bacterium GW2011_GWC2_39_35]KKR28401.1 MAG: hypothetical protein UT60_C0021G0005 [candidate division CPR2 bacterium GW2011_GWD2_39_7]KKS09847.1 MAG: hypothetical protein UU65_C0001G0252 [candidate division CPR2 bacterium GW2011_GWC1_41_48]OGB72584.1 MAG: hypothetical protein A2Y26_03220 [candidate division CPR2 bacterium GWD2_39_7]HBG81640.1 hypothetical protein [candidate division CPR2 bacterium]
MIHYYPFRKGYKKHPYLGITYAVSAMLAGSIATVIIKFFNHIPSLQITAYWLFIGSLISLTLNYFKDRETKVLKIIKKKPRLLILQTVTATLSAFFFVNAISLLNPSTAIFVYSTTFIVACTLIGKYSFDDKLSKIQYFSMFGALAGLTIITKDNLVVNSNSGFISIFLAAISLSISGSIVKKHFTPEETFSLNSLRSFLGGGFLLLLALLLQEPVFPSISALPLFLLGLMLANVIQYSFQYKAYDLEKLEVVSIIDSMRPFIVLILAFFFLQIMPKGTEILGGIIMIVSASLLILGNKKLDEIEN